MYILEKIKQGRHLYWFVEFYIAGYGLGQQLYSSRNNQKLKKDIWNSKWLWDCIKNELYERDD